MCCQTVKNRLDARASGLLSHIFGGNITSVVIDHQMAAPRLEEIAVMLTAPTRLVVEDDDSRRAFEIIAAVGPHIGPFGLAFAGIKLLHWRFIGVQHLALQEQFGQPVDQGLQAHA